MKSKVDAVLCASCKHFVKNIDNKGRVRYSCPFAPDVEWLGGYCRDPLNPYCGKYELKYKKY